MLQINEKDISKLATIRTTAFAKYYADVKNIEELKIANMFAKSNNLKLQVIGNGTNILFSQKQYKDIFFIKLKDGFNFFQMENNMIKIGASFSLKRAGQKLIKSGYENFMYMCLIPGAIGGAIRQNAGTTSEGSIEKNIISVLIYDIMYDEVRVFTKKEMEFSYRNSIVQEYDGRFIILSAMFLYGKKSNNIESLVSTLKDKKQKKKEKSPAGYSFGSTFKNLELPAWKYLKKINVCGEIIGGAKFSIEHCNWIINFNNASGFDVAMLIKKAKEKAILELGIELKEEVKII